MKEKTEKQKKENLSKKVVLYMLKVVAKEKPVYFVPFAMYFITNLMRKVETIILPKFLIDALVGLFNGEDLSYYLQRAILFAGITVGMQFAASVIEHLAGRIQNYYNEWFNLYFELKVNEHAMKIDFEHTENPQVLDQLHKAKEGMSWYSGNVYGILYQLFNIINNVVVILGVITIIAISCPLIIPIEVVSIGLCAIFNRKINLLEIKSFQGLAKQNRIFGYIFWELSDFTYGKDVRLYNSADHFNKRAEKHLDEQVKIWRNQAEGTKRQQYIINIITAITSGLTYFYIGLKAVKKVVSIGDFSMLVSATSNLGQSFDAIIKSFQEISKRSSYVQQYFDFMEYPDALQKGSLGIKKDGDHQIEFKNVSFKYPRSDEYVLENVNITIPSGQHLAVVGLNGAGKTTFIKLLFRLYDVTSGEILVDGINIKDYAEEEYRKLIAVVFQDFKLFCFTVKENIAFSLDADQSGIDEVLRQAGLYDEVQTMPHKELTYMWKGFEKDGIEFSGGQKQKTALARALYKNAPLVILDEPTAALDPIAEADIYSRFNTTLAGGRTAIYISHRLSSCKFCDKIAVFSEHTIKEYGSHTQLMKIKDGIYHNMFETQAKQYRKK